MKNLMAIPFCHLHPHNIGKRQMTGDKSMKGFLILFFPIPTHPSICALKAPLFPNQNKKTPKNQIPEIKQESLPASLSLRDANNGWPSESDRSFALLPPDCHNFQ